jgi:hypothetical protein
MHYRLEGAVLFHGKNHDKANSDCSLLPKKLVNNNISAYLMTPQRQSKLSL